MSSDIKKWQEHRVYLMRAFICHKKVTILIETKLDKTLKLKKIELAFYWLQIVMVALDSPFVCSNTISPVYT